MSKLFIMHSIGLNDVLSNFNFMKMKCLYMMYKHCNLEKIAIYSKKKVVLMSADVSIAHEFAMSHEECDIFT